MQNSLVFRWLLSSLCRRENNRTRRTRVTCDGCGMWIPHTIPRSTFSLFARPADAVVVGRLPPDGRAIASDDFGWADRTARPLRLLCLDVIAARFVEYPPHLLFTRIAPINAVYLTETLDTGLPVPSVAHVPDGHYWRRRLADPWPADSDAAVSRTLVYDSEWGVWRGGREASKNM